MEGAWWCRRWASGQGWHGAGQALLGLAFWIRRGSLAVRSGPLQNVRIRNPNAHMDQQILAKALRLLSLRPPNTDPRANAWRSAVGNNCGKGYGKPKKAFRYLEVEAPFWAAQIGLAAWLKWVASTGILSAETAKTDTQQAVQQQWFQAGSKWKVYYLQFEHLYFCQHLEALLKKMPAAVKEEALKLTVSCKLCCSACPFVACLPIRPCAAAR